MPRLLPGTFTTAAFGCSSSWQFGASSYKATPKGPPSSLRTARRVRVFLDTSPLKGSESLARVHPPFDRPMVLLHDVVQVGTGTAATTATELVLPLQFHDHLRIGRIAVYMDHARAGMTRSPQGSLEQDLGCSCIPLRRQPEVNRGAAGIHGTIKIGPNTCHRDLGFVHSPGTIGRLQFAAASLIEFRCVPLHPTPNGGVVHRETAFGDELFDIAIGEGISHRYQRTAQTMIGGSKCRHLNKV